MAANQQDFFSGCYRPAAERNDPADQVDCGAGADRHGQRGQVRAPASGSEPRPTQNRKSPRTLRPARIQIYGLTLSPISAFCFPLSALPSSRSPISSFRLHVSGLSPPPDAQPLATCQSVVRWYYAGMTKVVSIKMNPALLLRIDGVTSYRSDFIRAAVEEKAKRAGAKGKSPWDVLA